MGERERIEREAEERKLELQKKEEEEHIVEIRKTEEDDVVIKVPVEVCNKALDMKNFQLALVKAKEGDEDVKIKWANKKKKGKKHAKDIGAKGELKLFNHGINTEGHKKSDNESDDESYNEWESMLR